MSDNTVDSEYTLDNSSNLSIDKHLTQNEKMLLHNLNQTANMLQENSKKDLFDKSLNTILNEWSNNMSNILHDLSNTVFINKYIKTSDNLYEFFVLLSKDIWYVFTKESRLIYIGFTMIFVSFIIYFIHISS